jgi:hypothetical protein
LGQKHITSKLYNEIEYDLIKKTKKTLNKIKAKIIDYSNLELNEDNLCGDLSKKNNYWYTKLVFLGKTFYLMTRKDKASPYNTLIYYCNLRNTTLNSNKIGNNCK